MKPMRHRVDPWPRLDGLGNSIVQRVHTRASNATFTVELPPVLVTIDHKTVRFRGETAS